MTRAKRNDGESLDRVPFLKSSASVTLIRIAGAGLQAVIFALAARWYPVGVVGSYAAVYSAWAIARHVGPLGLDHAALRFAPAFLQKGDERRLRAFEADSRVLVCMVSTAVGMVCLLCIGLFARGGSSLGIWIALTTGVGLPIFALHGVHANQLRGRGFSDMAQLPESLLLPVLNCGFLILGHRFRFGGEAWLVVSATLAALLVLIIYRQADRAVAGPVMRLPRREFRAERRVAYEILAGQVATGLAVRLPVILVSFTLGTVAAAQMEAALRVQAVVLLIPTALAAVASPLFAGAYSRGDTTRVRDQLLAFNWLSFGPCLVLSAGLVVFGHHVLAVFGEGYASAYTPMVVLLFAAVLHSALTMASNVLYMTGHHRAVLSYSCVQLACLVVPFMALGATHFLSLTGVSICILVGWTLRGVGTTLLLPGRVGIAPGFLSLSEIRRSGVLARAFFTARRVRPSSA